MDELVIKREPGGPPTPETTPQPTANKFDEEPLLFVDDNKMLSDLSSGNTPGPAFDPYQLTQAPTELPITWKNCKNQDLAIQVQAREHAAEAAFVQLNQMKSDMRICAAEIPSAAKWLKKIEIILACRKKSRILIGLLGSTGAGKSSLINALLELVDLVPADDEKACTAVCVEIAWNPDTRPECRFHGEVHRISEHEWRVELERLMRDVNDQALGRDGDDGEPDLDRNLRIKGAFQKIKCVYPDIKDIEDLQNYSVAKLLADPHVMSLLGKKVTIYESDLQIFAARFKSYIDSTQSTEEGGRSFAQWPLVKCVNLYVKSRILEHGVVLVDLPGTMDTNAARGAIADNYQKTLSVTCVVAKTDRASSDKPAQDLLGKVTQRNLQMDGKFTSDGLCFVISKVDQSMSVDRYVRTHPNVNRDLAPIFENQARLHEVLGQASQLYDELTASKLENENRLRMYRSEMKKMAPEIKKVRALQNQQKRKRDEAPQSPALPALSDADQDTATRYKQLVTLIKDTSVGIDLHGSKLHKVSKKTEQFTAHLAKLESRKAAVCIQNRQQVQAQEIRADYEAAGKLIGLKTKTQPLQIFGVSALAFMDMIVKSKATIGFENKSDTGIPGLQKWLIQRSLPSRDRDASEFLEAIVSLEKSMTTWMTDDTVEFRMTDSQREAVEDLFAKNLDDVTKKLSILDVRVVQDLERRVTTQIYSKMQKAEIQATIDAAIIVKSRPQRPMTWGRHRTINKRKGWYKTSTDEYNWNEDIAGAYLEILLPHWVKVFGEDTRKLRAIRDEKISLGIRNFIADTKKSSITICTDLTEPLRHWTESSTRTIGIVQKHSSNVFNESIRDAASEAHRLVAPKVLEMWYPLYVECGNAYGKGHFKKNQKAHDDFIAKNGRIMYKRASNAIRNYLKKMWDGIPQELGEGTREVLAQIQDEFEEMLSNHTLGMNKEATTTGTTLTKGQLQDEVKNCYQLMKSAWAKSIEVIDISEELELADEELSIDDLLNDDQDKDADFEMFSDID